MKKIKLKMLEKIEKNVRKETGLNPEDWSNCSWLFYQPQRPNIEAYKKLIMTCLKKTA